MWLLSQERVIFSFGIVEFLKKKITKENKKAKNLNHLIQKSENKQLITVTTDSAVRINDANALSEGNPETIPIEDFNVREKTLHFDYECIPKRGSFARGLVAYGYFQVYRSIKANKKRLIFSTILMFAFILLANVDASSQILIWLIQKYILTKP